MSDDSKLLSEHSVAAFAAALPGRGPTAAVDAAAVAVGNAAGLISMAFRAAGDDEPSATWAGGRAEGLRALAERALALLDTDPAQHPERDVEVAEEALSALRLAAAGAPVFRGAARLECIAGGAQLQAALESALAARVVAGEPHESAARSGDPEPGDPLDPEPPCLAEVTALRDEAAALLEELRIAHRETTP